MEKRLKSYIDALFATAPRSAKTEEYKEEIYRNNLEKMNDLVSEGKTEDEAFKIVVDDMGDMTELFATLANEGVMNTASDKKHAKAAGKKRLPTVAKVFIIIGSITLGVCILICILTGVFVGATVGTVLNSDAAYYDGSGIHVDVGDIDTDIDSDGIHVDVGDITTGIDDDGVHVNVDDDINVEVGNEGIYVKIDGDKYAVASIGNYYDFSDISEIEINWSAGKVNIESYDGDKISVIEECSGTNVDPFVYCVNNGKLKIQWDKNFISILTSNSNRTLTVYVPENTQLKELKIDTASADAEMSGIQSDKIEIDTASGYISLGNVTAADMTINTASGDVSLIDADCGNAGNVNIDTASGFVSLENVSASSADISTVSGDVEISDCDIYELDAEAVSGSITQTGSNPTEISAETNSGYIWLTLTDISAKSELDIETISGEIDLNIVSDFKDFGIEFETVSGSFNSTGNISINSYNNIFTPSTKGQPAVVFEIETTSGDLNLDKR